MADTTNLEVLSTRNGFNSAVRHIKKTMEIAGSAGNFGDVIYELEDEVLSSAGAGMLLRMLLIDKLGYKAVSINLHSTSDDLVSLSKEFAKWDGVDLVAAYHHPELGLLIANPKIAEELGGFGQLRKRELLVVYAGLQGDETNDNCRKAAELALKLFEGSKVTVPPDFTKGKFTVKKAAKTRNTAADEKQVKLKPAKVKTGSSQAVPEKKAEPAASPVKMTPRYSVVVQNELFHNGNVEAWKKIIASYKAKYPNLEVFIYYDGERILDINSLFKWGKVKHGTAIEFAVAGDQIEDVAKLKRYLTQGASQMFEAFLHGPVNAVLRLF